MTRPKVLYVASQVPHPSDSGSAIREYHLLTAYANVAEVTLVCLHYGDDVQGTVDLTSVAPYCERIHAISAETTYGQSTFDRLPVWRQRLGQLVSRRPLPAMLAFSEAMRRVVEDLALQMDLVHVARLKMARHVEGIAARPVRPRLVLDLDDIETSTRLRELRTLRVPRLSSAVLAYLDLMRLARYQQRMLTSFDRVLVCSRLDEQRLGIATALVVPNGTVIPDLAPRDGSDGKAILFCGALSYGPNVDAMRYFLDSIFPDILREIPAARLLIVGRRPSAEVLALARPPQVTVWPDVPSVEPFYRQSTIAVAPLRTGGGTRLKILEAFAHEIPVVSTTIGCEGLDVRDGEHLLIADGDRQFARQCVRLLRAPHVRQELVSRARSLTVERYSWASVGAAFAHTIMSMLGRGPACSVGGQREKRRIRDAAGRGSSR
jgi:glycosyltransferase involved in cell wall biosynthesis